jgi:hypothetical protein
MIIRSYLRTVALAIVLVLAAVTARPASADTRVEADIFGDSLSDSGNVYGLSDEVAGFLAAHPQGAPDRAAAVVRGVCYRIR